MNYWFDSVMARGTGALIALLGAASAAAILLISLVVMGLQLYPTRLPDGYADLSLPELLWGSLTRMLSSGAFREDEGWGFRIAMLAATLCGLVLVAGLIGIISNAFDGRVLELRRGRSRVLESGHTLIVGWNATVLPMIGELATAGAEGVAAPWCCSAAATRWRSRTRLRASSGVCAASGSSSAPGPPSNPPTSRWRARRRLAASSS